MTKCIGQVKDCFRGSENTDELLRCVETIIPLQSDSYKILNVKGDETKFKAKIHAQITDTDDFISNYCIKNNETLRLYTKNNLSEYYRCKHNTRYEKTRDIEARLRTNPSARIQNTNCQFSMGIKNLDADVFNKIIEIEWNHNHSTRSLHSLTFKDIPIEVKSQIEKLFQTGLLPRAAHRELLRQLRSECNSELEYQEKLADRSILPRKPDFNRLYGLFTREKYGTADLHCMYEKLEEKISELKGESIDYEFACKSMTAKTMIHSY